MDANVEAATEGLHGAQYHVVPLFGHVGCQVERCKSSGPDAEYAFGEDAAVEGTFGREVSLRTFWPCLDGVWYAMPASDFGSFAMTIPMLMWYMKKFKTK